jgi:hypothetical protein
MDKGWERTKRVTVEIPERVWKAAAAFLPEGATSEERLPALAAAAFEEWVCWMEERYAQRRSRS